MQVVQTTEAACASLSRIVDKATGFPSRGTASGSGSHGTIPATWDLFGNTPFGWTMCHTATWFFSASDAWFEISDATAAIVAASPLLTAPEKAEVAAVLAGRATITDPTAAGTRKPKCTNLGQETVFCDGDSWTQGTVAPYHTWRSRIQALGLAEPGFKPFNMVGGKIDGDTTDPEHNGILASTITSHNLTNLSTNLRAWTPTVLLQFLGINDANAGTVDVPAFTQYWRDAHVARPDMKLVWMLPQNMWGVTSKGVNLDAYRAAVPGAISTLAGEGIVVTLHDFAGVLTAGAPDMLGDGGHPTSTGHDKLGDSFWNTFKSVVGYL